MMPFTVQDKKGKVWHALNINDQWILLGSSTTGELLYVTNDKLTEYKYANVIPTSVAVLQ